MRGLDIYKLSHEYVDYLQEKERKIRGFTKVSNNMSDEYNNSKPYIGVVLDINGYQYFAPLTHPKEHYKNSSRFFNQISTPIQLKNGRDYGRIMFCYMVPVCNNNVLEPIHINDIEDEKYKSVLMTQYFYMNSKEGNGKITKKANHLYHKVYKKPNHYLYKFCCDFELLEKISTDYQINK